MRSFGESKLTSAYVSPGCKCSAMLRSHSPGPMLFLQALQIQIQNDEAMIALFGGSSADRTVYPSQLPNLAHQRADAMPLMYLAARCWSSNRPLLSKTRQYTARCLRPVLWQIPLCSRPITLFSSSTTSKTSSSLSAGMPKHQRAIEGPVSLAKTVSQKPLTPAETRSDPGEPASRDEGDIPIVVTLFARD